VTIEKKSTPPAPKDQATDETTQVLPTVTEGQIVAAMLRSIATQLVRLADRLDAEAWANRPKPEREPKRRESLIERFKREGRW